MAIAAGFALGMLALILGADWLVRGAVRLAHRLKISALVVGLTVVAFGTSAPELAVSLQAAANNAPEIAIGNVVGSNIQNLTLVLGLCATFVSLKVNRRILWVDMPLLLVLSGVLAIMSLDGFISQADGFFLVATLAAYMWLCVRSGRTSSPVGAGQSHAAEQASPAAGTRVETPGQGRLAVSGLQILTGLFLLAEGGHLFVEAARSLAVRLGFSELTIGLTVVAFGTSLPEIVTCVIAAVRGHRDIAVGNAIGSNLFNILCVLGISSVAAAGGLPLSATAIDLDIPMMLAVTVLVYAVCLSGSRIVRGEGLLLLLIFSSYTGWLVANNSPGSGFSTPFAVLGTGLALVLIAFQIHALSRQSWIAVPEQS